MNVIIVGGGKILYFLCRRFLSKGSEVTIINKNIEECSDLARRLKAVVVHGDGSDPVILDDAGASLAEVVLSVTPNDHDNLVICQMAKLRFGVPRAVALVNDPDNEEAFKRLGVEAFSITRTISWLIEQRMASDEITNILPVGEGKVNITEILLKADSPLVQKRLSEIVMPKNSLVAVVMREGNSIVPHGATMLEANDRLVLITSPENYAQVIRLVTGERV